MKKIYFKNLNEYINKEITVEGFVENIRDLQYVQFLIVRDSSGKLQVTIEKNEENKELNEIVSDLTVESTVKIKGTLLVNEKVKLNGKELIPTEIIVTSKCLDELPLNYKDSKSALLDTRLNYRFLDLRSEKNLLMFKVQTCLINAMREFVLNKNFVEIHTPKFISTPSESGSNVFEVKYFDRKAYLAQSPQFYKQMAMCSGFENVFEVAPAFRAENSNSYRHATEFNSFDIEMSYVENLEDLYKELEKKYNFKMNYEDVGDMNAESEKLASEYIKEKYGHEFVFITDFSAKKRAFYHKRNNGVPMGADLIWKGCETTTLALREHRYEELCKQANEKGLGEDVKFYLEFFKYGCPPHGGFALGVERVTMLLLETGSLKETMFLFRGPSRLEP